MSQFILILTKVFLYFIYTFCNSFISKRSYCENTFNIFYLDALTEYLKMKDLGPWNTTFDSFLSQHVLLTLASYYLQITMGSILKNLKTKHHSNLFFKFLFYSLEHIFILHLNFFHQVNLFYLCYSCDSVESNISKKNVKTTMVTMMMI